MLRALMLGMVLAVAASPAWACPGLSHEKCVELEMHNQARSQDLSEMQQIQRDWRQERQRDLRASELRQSLSGIENAVRFRDLSRPSPFD